MTSIRFLMLSVALAWLAGCGTDTPPWSDCDWAEPIRPSQADQLTDETVAQILTHNEIGARLCGWAP